MATVIPVVLPGVSGYVSVRSPGWFARGEVLLNGLPAPAGPVPGTVLLPTVEGGSRTVQIAPGHPWRPLALEVDGTRIPVGPQVALAMTAVAALPLALVFLGGLVGLATGGVAFAFNQRIARSGLPGPVRVMAMLVLGAVATGLFVLAMVMLNLPEPRHG